MPSVVSTADVIVAAIRQPEMVKKEWVKPGAVVIDVGINSIPGEQQIEITLYLVQIVPLLYPKHILCRWNQEDWIPFGRRCGLCRSV